MATSEKAAINSREELKKAQKKEVPKKIRLRIFPIWLRVLIVLFLMVVCAAAGLIVGYGVIGNGEPLDALKASTWQHIIDLVEKDH
jgi:hypothetical protein